MVNEWLRIIMSYFGCRSWHENHLLILRSAGEIYVGEKQFPDQHMHQNIYWGVSEILHRGGCNNFVSGDYQVWEIISEYFVVFPKLEKDGSYGRWSIEIEIPIFDL